MRKEYVSYNGNIPVKVELLNIKEHPIHWHDAIELLMVLKGSIEVTIESDNYVVEENEIEIINMEECFSTLTPQKKIYSKVMKNTRF